MLNCTPVTHAQSESDGQGFVKSFSFLPRPVQFNRSIHLFHPGRERLAPLVKRSVQRPFKAQDLLGRCIPDRRP